MSVTSVTARENPSDREYDRYGELERLVVDTRDSLRHILKRADVNREEEHGYEQGRVDGFGIPWD